MKKIQKTVAIDYMLDWQDFVSISKIKKDLEKIEKLGATHIEIEIRDNWGDSYLEIKANYRRLETDEEFKIRENKFKEKLDYIKNEELQKLKELKAKYE